MLDEQALEATLRKALPPEYHSYAPQLARMLAAAVADDDGAAPGGDAPLPRDVVAALAGQRLRSGGSTLSFGADSQIGDVRVRDVVSGDVHTLNIPVSLPEPVRPRREREERKLVLFGITIFQSVTTRTIELLTFGILATFIGLAGVIVVGRFLGPPAGPVLPATIEPTIMPATPSVEPEPTFSPAALEPTIQAVPPEKTARVVTEGGVSVNQSPITLLPTNTIAPPTATTTPTALPIAAPTPTRPRPTATARSPRLAFVLIQEGNDLPECISARIIGIAATGWLFSVDGLALTGMFNGGDARVCGLAAGQEITFTVFDGSGRVIPGGAGVPARGGDILAGTWR